MEDERPACTFCHETVAPRRAIWGVSPGGKVGVFHRLCLAQIARNINLLGR